MGLFCYVIIKVMKKRIRKTKVNWLVSDTSLIAFDRIQATVYHAYDTPNKQPLDEMKKIILQSGANEYNTWADVIDLAIKKGIRGYGIRLKREWFTES